MSLRRFAVLVLLAFCVPASAADDDLPSAQDLADSAAQRFPQPVRVGDLLSRKVLEPDESRPLLGRVGSVVKRRDGTVAVVMQYGGVLGFFTHPIAVPVNAMVLVGQDMEVMEYDPDQLKKFPTFKPDGTRALPPDSIIRVALGKPSH
jgi:hypothetical protein